jgi:hypothetical protein
MDKTLDQSQALGISHAGENNGNRRGGALHRPGRLVSIGHQDFHAVLHELVRRRL